MAERRESPGKGSERTEGEEKDNKMVAKEKEKKKGGRRQDNRKNIGQKKAVTQEK